MIKWSEPDLVAFFGVVPNYCVVAESHSFELQRDGLRLLVTLFGFEGAVYVSVFRDGLPEPLFTVIQESCTHAYVTDGQRSPRCFQAGAPEGRVTEMGIPPVLVRGVRIYIEPQFQVELIEPRYEHG